MAASERAPALALRSTTEPSIVVLTVSGAISRGAIPMLCDEAHRLLAGRALDVVICDIADLTDVDAVTVDALARLQLTARGLGCRIRVWHADESLQELLELTGLVSVVPLWERLAVESRRQAEEGEVARGVEEEADPGDHPT